MFSTLIRKVLTGGSERASKEGSPIEALQWGDVEKEQREEKRMVSPAPGTWLLQGSAIHASLKTWIWSLSTHVTQVSNSSNGWKDSLLAR